MFTERFDIKRVPTRSMLNGALQCKGVSPKIFLARNFAIPSLGYNKQTI
jgi:hypothetical protein